MIGAFVGARLRRVRLGFLAVALATATTTACASDDRASDDPLGEVGTEEVQPGGTVTFGADQEPAGFNPNVAGGNSLAVNNVIGRVFPSVFRVDPSFEPVLDDELMDSVELTDSEPQTVVYKINPRAVWSDGVPISADDFVYWWQMARGDGVDVDGSVAEVASTAGYEDIASVTGSEDGKTVTVVFEKPYGDWKSLFSLAVLPSHIARRVGWNTGFATFDPAVVISGGPFRIESHNPGQDLTLVRNERYWGEPAKLDRIVFRFIPQSAEQIPALRNREVDVIYPQPQLDAVTQLESISGVRTEVGQGLAYEHLTLNTRQEFLALPEVRQALALALDRAQVVERTVGQVDDRARPLGSRIYVNSQPEYDDNSGRYGERDLPAARALLEGLGFTPGPDGIYQRGGKRLSLRLSTTAGNALREQQGVLIQSQVREAGIELRIDNSPAAILQRERLPQGNFDIANFGWSSSPFPSGFADIFGTDRAANYGKYANAEVDALFREAGAALDDGARTALYNEIDRRLWDDMATIPLYQKPTLLAYRSTLVNIADNATVHGIFWNAETWGVRSSP
ncbi:MAG TPA: ABC transporter family substrate-binding protein [Acidimicrobiales bacterium]|nr:ABC transporter family substrate-binding protein [Acidimicrobiales bacterium]